MLNSCCIYIGAFVCSCSFTVFSLKSTAKSKNWFEIKCYNTWASMDCRYTAVLGDVFMCCWKTQAFGALCYPTLIKQIVALM